MSWLFFAFCGPVLWALSVHLDKYLVERYFKHSGVSSLMIFAAAFALLMLPVLWVLRPNVVAIDVADACALSASGVLYMGALFFYLQALKVEEASVVAPFFQAAPLFGYVLSYVVLGERLTLGQDFGGLMIIGGTALLSIRADKPPMMMMKARLIALMLTCALSMSVASLIFKIFAIADEFWTATFWSFVGQAGFGAGPLASAASREQLGALIRSGAGRVLGISGINELVNLAGTLGVRYALLLAPLSLVQAVASTTSLFVFLFGVVLSIVAPWFGAEDLSTRNLIQKTVSAVLVAIGVIFINR
jgi:uncharacterized membrane protein